LNASYEEALLETRSSLLEQAGFHVLNASNFVQVRKACAFGPSLIILGHSIPYDECKRIREVVREFCPAVPVLSLTRGYGWEVAEGEHAMNAQEGPEALVARVKEILK
jgi:DNA-binding response OmpR family regulator